MSTWFNSGKQLIKKMNTHRVTGLAAEQAFYYLLSIFPLLILLLSILPYLSINPQVISNLTHDFIPEQTAKLVEETVFSILRERNSSLLTIGIVGTIWSSSNGINAFIHSMNIAYEVEETRNYLMNRFLAIIMTLGLICAFIIALILPVFGNIILDIVDKLSTYFQWNSKLNSCVTLGNCCHCHHYYFSLFIQSSTKYKISIKQVLVGCRNSYHSLAPCLSWLFLLRQQLWKLFSNLRKSRRCDGPYAVVIFNGALTHYRWRN